MNKEILQFNKSQSPDEGGICDKLMNIIDKNLTPAECKIWHAHPVWFLDENPIVGYRKLKDGIRLMFWSGASFNEEELVPGTGKFKDASITYTHKEEITEKKLKKWLKKAKDIQWDYKNITKRKGELLRIK